MRKQVERDYYSVSEAAARTGVAASTMYGIIQRGELAHTRVGNSIRISRAGLKAYLAARTSSTWARVDRRGRQRKAG